MVGGWDLLSLPYSEPEGSTQQAYVVGSLLGLWYEVLGPQTRWPLKKNVHRSVVRVGNACTIYHQNEHEPPTWSRSAPFIWVKARTCDSRRMRRSGTGFHAGIPPICLQNQTQLCWRFIFVVLELNRSSNADGFQDLPSTMVVPNYIGEPI